MAEQILEGVNQMLSEKGLKLREGTILDATIIAAPISTKSKRKEREPEMHSAAKGNRWFRCCAEGFAYGMRSYIAVDAVSGLAHSVSRSSNVHELTIGADRLNGEYRPYTVMLVTLALRSGESSRIVTRSSGFP